MNTDTAFYIGKSHDICEDYITNFSIFEFVNRIILCDGCSSSKMTDIGSRILALTSAKILDTYLFTNWENFYTTFLEYIDKSYLFQINNTIFDATLCIVQEIEKEFKFLFIGDGVLFIQYNDGNSYILDISFPKGYPRYLSYEFNSNRMLDFISLDSYREINEYYNFSKKFFCLLNYRYRDTKFFEYTISKNNIKFITIFSDGIHSFIDENKNKISFIDIIKELVDYKTFNGKFVQRRFNTFKKNCDKLKWSHYDDISMGTIYVG